MATTAQASAVAAMAITASNERFMVYLPGQFGYSPAAVSAEPAKAVTVRIEQRLLGGPEVDLDLGSHPRWREAEHVAGAVVTRNRFMLPSPVR
jgi:hypothetical protein